MKRNVIAGIGNTPLVQLQHLVPENAADIFVKLEWANPTGSMKDRMAKSAIESAEADRKIKPGDTVIEYTAGTTGVSLAFVCAAMGYKFHAVFSDAFSDEKRFTMQAFGGKITDVISDNKKITAALIKEMIAKAKELSSQPGHWWCDQLNNPDAARGYHSLGEEIWQQMNGKIDAFIHCVSTTHSLHGATEALWKRNKNIFIGAIEPDESAVLSGRASGAHKIEGIGIGFIPPLWKPDLVNEIFTVTTDDAKAMARKLAKVEGVFAGTSSGANVVAALRLAERLGKGKNVVTLMVDSGLRYLSTDVYRNF
jgi:cysteine synthase A